MDQTEKYKNIISEMIAKQAVVLGPEIAILKSRNVSGLTVNDKGEVVSIDGNPSEVLQSLIDEYISLSGEIVKNVMRPIFEKYPEISKEVN